MNSHPKDSTIARKTVLVVEDSPTQATQTRRLLMANGLQVIIASNGTDGMATAMAHRPDLVLLDWELPDMNGGDVVRLLKSQPRTRKIPVIIFTRYNNPQIKEAGMQDGAVDFIPKDAFASVVLVETMKQMGLITTKSSGAEWVEV